MDQPIIRKLLAIQESQDQIARFFSVFQDTITEDAAKKSTAVTELLALFCPQFRLILDDGMAVSEATDHDSMCNNTGGFLGPSPTDILVEASDYESTCNNIGGFLGVSPTDILVGASVLHDYRDDAGEVEITMKGVSHFVINTIGKYAGQLIVTRNEYTLKGSKFCYLKISVMSEHIFRQSQ